MYSQRRHVPARPGLSNALQCGDGGWAGANVRNDQFGAFLKLISAAGVEHDLGPDDWQRGAQGASSPQQSEHPAREAVCRDGLARRVRGANARRRPGGDAELRPRRCRARAALPGFGAVRRGQRRGNRRDAEHPSKPDRGPRNPGRAAARAAPRRGGRDPQGAGGGGAGRAAASGERRGPAAGRPPGDRADLGAGRTDRRTDAGGPRSRGDPHRIARAAGRAAERIARRRDTEPGPARPLELREHRQAVFDARPHAGAVEGNLARRGRDRGPRDRQLRARFVRSDGSRLRDAIGAESGADRSAHAGVRRPRAVGEGTHARQPADGRVRDQLADGIRGP